MNVKNVSISFNFSSMSLNMVIPLIDDNTILMNVFRPIEELPFETTSSSISMDVNTFKKDIVSILELIFRRFGKSDLNYLKQPFVYDAVVDLIKNHIITYKRLLIDDLCLFADMLIYIVSYADQQRNEAEDLYSYHDKWSDAFEDLVDEFDNQLLIIDPITKHFVKYK